MTTESPRREFLKQGLASSLGVALGPAFAACCPCYVAANRTWSNALNIDGVDPERIEEPKSLVELVDVVRRAESAGAGVRMTGSGHSFSDVAFSEDVLLRPTGLNRVLTLDRDRLKEGLRNNKFLVRVESGITLRQLNPYLFGQGFSLQNAGGYDAQTVVGAAITGTHGSGLAYGPIASQIQSLEVVGTGGEVLQVEPSAGITDAARFSGFIDTARGRVPAKLVQDDETFNALLVSMGCLGVVYAVVLQVEPRYWLKEVREKTTWAKVTSPGGFLRRLLDGQKLDAGSGPDPTYYEVYVNPYPTHGQHTTMVTKRYKLRPEPERLTLDDRTRGRYGTGAIEAAAEVTGKGAALVDHMNAYPESVPGIIDASVDALVDASYVNAGYKVFNLGPVNTIRAYGIEMGFDIKQTLPVVERLFRTAAELRERGWMHSSPPSLRFVRQSNAHLAMMHDHPTMMLEMGMLVCANNSDALLRTYEERFIDEFRARPHWGLDLNVLRSFDQVRRLYPSSADRWLAVYRRMNARGTFNATFTDRLGISVERS